MKLDALETKDNYLVIELPQFDFPLVYSEIEYPLPKTTFTIDIIPNATANSTSFSSSASASSSTAASAAATSASLSTIASSSSAHPPIVVKDLELFRDNPIENKHRKLARSHRNGPLDRDLKPNAKIRDELNVKWRNRDFVFYPSQLNTHLYRKYSSTRLPKI